MAHVVIKNNDQPKKTTVATAKGTASSGQPHLTKHAVGKLGSNKKVY